MKKKSRLLSVLILFGIFTYLLVSKYFRGFRLIRHTALDDVNVIDEVSYDFEDLPMERIFAYVWFAYLDWEFCAALASLKKLQNLRKSSMESSEDTFEYILLMYELGEDETFLKLNAIESWVQLGGKIAEFSIPHLLKTQDHWQKRNWMKYMGSQLDHDWIIVLDPFAVPLRPLDELFHIYNNSRLQGGALESTLIALSKLPKRDKEISEEITFLTFAPIPELATRLNDSLFLVNDEWTGLTSQFAQDELLILPSWYSSPMTSGSLKNTSLVMIRGPQEMQMLKKSSEIQWYNDVRHCVVNYI